MPRPVTPNYVVPTWAPNVNYPVTADPWSATPTKTAHAGAASVGITPKTAVAAQVFNKVINDAYTTDGLVQTAVVNLYDWLGLSVVLNFGPTAAAPSALAGAVYNSAKRGWFFVGPTGKIYASFSNGFSPGANVISGVAAGTENVRFIDVDASGNMCAAMQTAFVFAFNGTTWAKTAVGTASVTIGDCGIVWDPIHSLWCFQCVDAGANNNVQIYTSPDRATWTARTGSLGYVGYNPTRIGVNKVTGRIALVSLNGATARPATSDDGGVTWTTRATFTVADAAYTEAEVFHNPTTGKWLFIAGKSGTTCDIWTSADAITWTRAITLATVQILRAAPDGYVWAAVSSVGDVLYTLDDGATWRFAGYQVPATAKGIQAGNGGLMLISTTVVAPSFRGNPTGALAT